jgi:hypothetical protein
MVSLIQKSARKSIDTYTLSVTKKSNTSRPKGDGRIKKWLAPPAFNHSSKDFYITALHILCGNGVVEPE